MIEEPTTLARLAELLELTERDAGRPKIQLVDTRGASGSTADQLAA